MLGRPSLDLMALAKDQVKLSSYDLPELILSQFPVESDPLSGFAKRLRENQMIFKCCARLKIFSLSLELSNVAGCLWRVSL